MKNIQVTVPVKSKGKVKKVLENYSRNITLTEAEKNGKKVVRFSLSLDPEKIDELTKELKSVEGIGAGDLTIQILDQSTVIEKGKAPPVYSRILSIEEMRSKARELSSFDRLSWALIILSASMASLGFLLENIPVLIGAMLVAPVLSPFLSASFSIVVGDGHLIKRSLLSGAAGMLIVMFAGSLVSLFAGATVTPLMLLLGKPNVFMLILSLLVGAASAIAFKMETREQFAGVAVAIALLPPSVIAGMSIPMMRYDLFLDSILVVFTNIVAIILAGGVTFKAMGIEPVYYKKKVAEEQARRVLSLSFIVMLLIAVPIVYLSYQDYKKYSAMSEVEKYLEGSFGDIIINKRIDVDRYSVDVKLVVTEDIDYIKVKRDLERLTKRGVLLKVIKLRAESYGD